MFSTNHIIWMLLSFSLILAVTVLLRRRRPPLKRVLNVACVVCGLSELVKVFSTIELVPSADGSGVYPYLELQHLPFHLCSIQILFILYTRFGHNDRLRETLLAFMYPTCVIGAFCALLMPSIFSTSISVDEAFTHPLAYQFFLYHAMLIILGAYIPVSGAVQLRARHYGSTLAILAGLALVSIYLNSALATPVYEDGVLQSVEYTTNFFFTYRLPISLAITERWQWFTYLGVLCLLGVLLVGLMYLPYFRKGAPAREQLAEE